MLLQHLSSQLTTKPFAVALVALWCLPSLAAWTSHWSPEHNRTYYWNSSVGESVWVLPYGAEIESNNVVGIDDLNGPTTQTSHTASVTGTSDVHEGWRDCTAEASTLYSGTGLQRAYRSMARSGHPDKGGSSEQFQSITAVRDMLQSPLRYFAYKILRDHDEAKTFERSSLHLSPMQPFRLDVNDSESAHHSGDDDSRTGTTSEGLVIDANVLLGEERDGSGWPRLTIQAKFSPIPHVDLSHSHVWRLGLAHSEGTTMEYKGDADAGGFDVCCHFIKDSKCELRPRDDVVALLNATKNTVESQGGSMPSWFQQRHVHFVHHDCPLPNGAPFIASVAKPLPKRRSGAWSAVLLLLPSDDNDNRNRQKHDRNVVPTACLSVRFGVSFVARPPATPPPAQDSTASRTGDVFEQMSHGKWCSDGADILEGHLDSYTDCDPTTHLCALTRKCRIRCEKRKTCMYYTTFNSGFCQLSSRCNQEVVASDSSAQTFKRRQLH